jgi:hypothetical protein
VLRRYSDVVSTQSASTTSQNRFSSSPAKGREKIGSESKRGKHHHTMRAWRLSERSSERPMR